MTQSISVPGAGNLGSMFPVVKVDQTNVDMGATCGDHKISTADCEAMLLRAWQMAEERYGPDDLAVGSALANLAEFYQARGQTNEASECDRRIRVILNGFLSSVA